MLAMPSLLFKVVIFVEGSFALVGLMPLCARIIRIQKLSLHLHPPILACLLHLSGMLINWLSRCPN